MVLPYQLDNIAPEMSGPCSAESIDGRLTEIIDSFRTTIATSNQVKALCHLNRKLK